MNISNNKPLILELEEAKTEIIASINNALQNHNLPCYLLEPIVSALAAQIKEGAKSELEMAKAQMKQQDEEVA